MLECDLPLSMHGVFVCAALQQEDRPSTRCLTVTEYSPVFALGPKVSDTRERKKQECHVRFSHSYYSPGESILSLLNKHLSLLIYITLTHLN